MKCRSVFVTVIAALMLLTLSAFGMSKGKGNITVYKKIQVGPTQLMPGHYQVEWNGANKQVKLNILHFNKNLVSVPAKVVTHTRPATYDALVTTQPKNDKLAQLQEIDFHNRTQALVLERGKTAN